MQTQTASLFSREAGEAVVSVSVFAPVGKPLAYRVPEPMRSQVTVGSLVRVPLGRRTELGVVRGLGSEEPIAPNKLKYIHAPAQAFPVLTPDLLALGEWLARYYGAEVHTVLEGMIPAAVRRGMRPKQRRFLALARRPAPEEIEQLAKRAPKQGALLRFLAQQPQGARLQRSNLLERLGVPASACDGLVKKGLVEEYQGVEQRTAYEDEHGSAEAVSGAAVTLTEEQAAAVEALHASLEAGGFAPHLLHGVTGSGKTEVYLRALVRTLEKGGGALVLVPEVALTPQTVGRIRARLQALGVAAVVWHSHLAEGERYDAWHALATGKARVVVGARSAVFAPIRDLRLVVVDEEHEPAYKQEETPRYHGRDTALYRARLCEATCVLGSATPSLESHLNAENGRYGRMTLSKRVDNRQLPLVHVVDMTREVRGTGQVPLFSRLLEEKLHERLEASEQAILFLNRRGFHASLLCPDCGFVAMCDHCSVTLTYHRVAEVLRCHLCGFEDPAPRRCPKCRSPQIHWRGSGTQRVEELTRKLFPSARLARLDADTMQKKNAFRDILSSFRRGRLDILIGTQMIAKGLDFPNVTLVGLVSADITLHLPDFRAHERGYQLLTQVAGRAGRGDRAGEVVVQTFVPHNPAIQLARRQDYAVFAQDELAQRKEYGYPPYRHLVHQLFRGRNAEKVTFFAERFARVMQERLPTSVEVRGPAPAPIEKIKDEYRIQLWYFAPSVTDLVSRIQALRQDFPLDKEVRDTLDVDPVNLI